MSNIKELIRQEIDKRYAEYRKKMKTDDFTYYEGMADALDLFEQFLDTLPDEPERPTIGYDEAYLNEKIAKASKSWEGVDVDKFMEEIRGREPVTDYYDLKKHTKEWVELMVGASFPEQDGDLISEEDYRNVIKKTALHFAEWQKRKMMEGAEECELYWDGDFLAIDLNMRELGYSERDKVKIIIVKEDKK